MRIKTRLTIWFTLLVTLVTAISGMISWFSLKSTLQTEMFKEALNKANQVQNVILFLAAEYQNKQIPFSIEDPEVFLYLFSENNEELYDGVYLQLSGNKGVFARSPNLSGHSLPILNAGSFSSFSLDFSEKKRVNVFYYCTEIKLSGLIIASLQIGIPLSKSEDFLRRLTFYESIKLFLVFFFSVFLGLFLSNKALKPVSGIRDEVERMTITDISKRIDLTNLSPDEIGKLAETFNRLLERIDHSVQAQNRFISDASHELRSPLTAIIGHAELLERRAGENPELLKKSSKVIIQEGERLVKLVNDLLFLARSGTKKTGFQQVNLNRLIQETFFELQPLYPQIEIFLPKETFFVQGFAEDLKRVLLNLINNSLAVIPKENGSIRLELSQKGDYCEIMVKDNGPGIPAEHLSRIFERFYRIDKARSRTDGGSGLGLAITAEIVRNHQGTISVRSEQNKGSTFLVRLPLRKS